MNSEAAVWGCYVAGNWTCVPNRHAWGLGGACDQAERYTSYKTCRNRAKEPRTFKQPAKKDTAKPGKKRLGHDGEVRRAGQLTKRLNDMDLMDHVDERSGAMGDHIFL